MRIVAWNIRAGGGERVGRISRYLERWAPDAVVLSEFRATPPSLELARSLASHGLSHQCTSASRRNPRANALLVAARWPVSPLRLRAQPREPGRWLLVSVNAPRPLLLGAMHVPNRVTGRKYLFLDSVLACARRWRLGPAYFLQAPPAVGHPDVIRHEIEQMMWTEELGFDSIWLTEHHFIDYGLSVSPAVLAAAAAMRTRRVRIGLAAAILPFYDPVRLAEELAMVDILSEGRLDVGVGRGNRPVEFEGYRVPQIENRERFDESLAIIVKAWTAERFSFEGRHFTIPEVRVIPKPLQRPHPPIYVVCTSPDTIEATALRGVPMLNSLLRGGVEQLAKSRD